MRSRAGRDYRIYRWSQCGLILALLLYLLVVVERERVMGRAEIFPIASWSLFSLTPNDVIDYSLVFTEINDQPIAPPAIWEESRAYFPAAGHHSAYVVIAKIGRATAAGNAAESKRLREKFEALFLGDVDTARYELVVRTFDPLHRWRTGEYARVESLAWYHKGAP